MFYRGRGRGRDSGPPGPPIDEFRGREFSLPPQRFPHGYGYSQPDYYPRPDAAPQGPPMPRFPVTGLPTPSLPHQNAPPSRSYDPNFEDRSAMMDRFRPPVYQNYDNQQQSYQHGGDSHRRENADSSYSSTQAKADDRKLPASKQDTQARNERVSSKSSENRYSHDAVADSKVKQGSFSESTSSSSHDTGVHRNTKTHSNDNPDVDRPKKSDFNIDDLLQDERLKNVLFAGISKATAKLEQSLKSGRTSVENRASAGRNSFSHGSSSAEALEKPKSILKRKSGSEKIDEEDDTAADSLSKLSALEKTLHLLRGKTNISDVSRGLEEYDQQQFVAPKGALGQLASYNDIGEDSGSTDKQDKNKKQMQSKTAAPASQPFWSVAAVPGVAETEEERESSDIKEKLFEQWRQSINRAAEGQRTTIMQENISQVDPFFQNKIPSNGPVASHTVKEKGDNNGDEELDSTVQNILQSIGFNFDLSKRMQELARQKKKKHDTFQTGIINQSATFLGQSDELAENVQAALFSIKHEHSDIADLIKEARASVQKNSSRYERSGSPDRSSEHAYKDKKYGHKESSPESFDRSRNEYKQKKRTGHESHDIQSERRLEKTHLQLDWDTVSPDEDEWTGTESRRKRDKTIRLCHEKVTEIKQSFSREDDVATPPTSRYLNDRRRQSEKVVSSRHDDSSQWISERFSDEPKDEYFYPDDSEHAASSKAVPLLTTFSSRRKEDLSTNLLRSLKLPSQSGTTHVENLRVTSKAAYTDDEAFAESRRIIVSRSPVYRGSSSPVHFDAQSPIYKSMRSPVYNSSRPPIYKGSRSPDSRQFRKRSASPMTSRASKERRIYGDRDFTDLQSFFKKSSPEREKSPISRQSFDYHTDSYRRSPLPLRSPHTAFNRAGEGGMKTPERIKSPIRDDYRRREDARKSPDRRSVSPGVLQSKPLIYRRSRSPDPRRSRSPVPHRSRSPFPRRSRSPFPRRSRSPFPRRSRSPFPRKSRSPVPRRSRSPVPRRSRSPFPRKTRSPFHHRSRSPGKYRSRSPGTFRSKSPKKRKSRSRSAEKKRKSPIRYRSPVRNIHKAPVSWKSPRRKHPVDIKRYSSGASSERKFKSNTFSPKDKLLEQTKIDVSKMSAEDRKYYLQKLLEKHEQVTKQVKEDKEYNDLQPAIERLADFPAEQRKIILLKMTVMSAEEKQKVLENLKLRQVRASVLKSELEKLQKTQNEIMRKCQRSEANKPLLLQSTETLETIEMEIKRLTSAELDVPLTEPMFLPPSNTSQSVEKKNVPKKTASNQKTKPATDTQKAPSNTKYPAKGKKLKEKPLPSSDQEKRTSSTSVISSDLPEVDDVVKKSSAKTNQPTTDEVKVMEKDKLDKDMKQDTRVGNLSQSSSSKQVYYEYCDGRNHWCQLCSTNCNSLGQFFMHSHGKQHLAKINDEMKPWKKYKRKEPSARKVGLSQSRTVKGTEMMFPVVGFYCSLCSVFCGDFTDSKDHLMNDKHYEKYKEFIRKNPLYEKTLLLEKSKELSKKKKPTPEAPPPQPPVPAPPALIPLPESEKIENSSEKCDEAPKIKSVRKRRLRAPRITSVSDSADNNKDNYDTVSMDIDKDEDVQKVPKWTKATTKLPAWGSGLTSEEFTSGVEMKETKEDDTQPLDKFLTIEPDSLKVKQTQLPVVTEFDVSSIPIPEEQCLPAVSADSCEPGMICTVKTLKQVQDEERKTVDDEKRMMGIDVDAEEEQPMFVIPVPPPSLLYSPPSGASQGEDEEECKKSKVKSLDTLFAKVSRTVVHKSKPKPGSIASGVGQAVSEMEQKIADEIRAKLDKEKRNMMRKRQKEEEKEKKHEEEWTKKRIESDSSSDDESDNESVELNETEAVDHDKQELALHLSQDTMSNQFETSVNSEQVMLSDIVTTTTMNFMTDEPAKTETKDTEEKYLMEVEISTDSLERTAGKSGIGEAISIRNEMFPASSGDLVANVENSGIESQSDSPSYGHNIRVISTVRGTQSTNVISEDTHVVINTAPNEVSTGYLDQGITAMEQHQLISTVITRHDLQEPVFKIPVYIRPSISAGGHCSSYGSRNNIDNTNIIIVGPGKSIVKATDGQEGVNIAEEISVADTVDNRKEENSTADTGDDRTEEISIADTVDDRKEEINTADTVDDRNEVISIVDTVSDRKEDINIAETVDDGKEEISIADRVSDTNEVINVADTVGDRNEDISIADRVSDTNEVINVADTVGDRNEDISIADTVDDRKQEISIVDTVDDRKEENSIVDTIDDRKEENSIVDAVDDRKEENSIVDTIDDRKEENSIVDTIDDRKEENSIVDTIDDRKEENSIVDAVDDRKEENGIVDTVDDRKGDISIDDVAGDTKEVINIADTVDDRNEDNNIADTADDRKEEISIADTVDDRKEVSIADTVDDRKEVSIADTVDGRNENNNIADTVDDRKEVSIADTVDGRKEGISIADAVDDRKEEVSIADTDNYKVEESSIADTDNYKVEESSIADAVDDRKEEVSIADTDNYKVEESSIADTDNYKVEESSIADAVDDRKEEVSIADTDNYKVEESSIADTDNYKVEESSIADAVDDKKEEVSIADTDNYKVEESSIADAVDDRKEEVSIADTDNYKVEESSIADTDNYKVEESNIADTVDDRKEEVSAADIDFGEDITHANYVVDKQGLLVDDTKEENVYVENMTETIKVDGMKDVAHITDVCLSREDVNDVDRIEMMDICENVASEENVGIPSALVEQYDNLRGEHGNVHEPMEQTCSSIPDWKEQGSGLDEIPEVITGRDQGKETNCSPNCGSLNVSPEGSCLGSVQTTLNLTGRDPELSAEVKLTSTTKGEETVGSFDASDNAGCFLNEQTREPKEVEAETSQFQGRVTRSRTRKDQADCQDMSKNTADEDKVGHTAEEDKVGHTAEDDKLGHTAEDDKLGHTADEDKLGHTADEDKVGHTSGEDKVGHTADEDRLGHTSDEDKVGCIVDEDKVGHTAAGEDKVGHTADEDKVGHTADEDKVGHTADEDKVGHTADEDKVGHTADEDKVGHTADEDKVGCIVDEDNVGHTADEDKVGHTSDEDKVGHTADEDKVGCIVDEDKADEDKVGHTSDEDKVGHTAEDEMELDDQAADVSTSEIIEESELVQVTMPTLRDSDNEVVADIASATNSVYNSDPCQISVIRTEENSDSDATITEETEDPHYLVTPPNTDIGDAPDCVGEGNNMLDLTGSDVTNPYFQQPGEESVSKFGILPGADESSSGQVVEGSSYGKQSENDIVPQQQCYGPSSGHFRDPPMSGVVGDVEESADSMMVSVTEVEAEGMESEAPPTAGLSLGLDEDENTMEFAMVDLDDKMKSIDE